MDIPVELIKTTESFFSDWSLTAKVEYNSLTVRLAHVGNDIIGYADPHLG